MQHTYKDFGVTSVGRQQHWEPVFKFKAIPTVQDWQVSNLLKIFWSFYVQAGPQITAIFSAHVWTLLGTIPP